ncbi:MAG: cysteine--tRNA ligase [Parachlamydiales bacterium]
MDLTLYNSKTRQAEAIGRLGKKSLTLYTCGPTVYSYAHIGNFRTYVFEDLLRRTLEWLGYKVTQVMNLTDVDDKTIKGAIAEKKGLGEFTQPFIDAFFEDLKTLRIQPAHHYPKATDYIPKMCERIQQLIERGYAYQEPDGSVYFSVESFPAYGALSHLDLDQLQAGASERVAHDEYERESVSDFVLWKAYDPKRDGEIFWESPFGKGRPGWHMECSTMALELLGDTVDLHCGGIDNLFPHHENEIAQSEGCTGKTFVNHWAHSEHLIVEGKKMSKSLGNFYTLRQLLEKGYTGAEVRYLLLNSHYRMQLNFTFEGMMGARHALERLSAFARRLRETEGDGGAGLDAAKMVENFKAALAEDLNVSAAMAVLFDFVREANALLDAGTVSRKEAQAALSALQEINRFLDVIPMEEEEAPKELQEMAHEREAARKAKNFSLADTLRDKILAQGYLVEDTPKGPRLKKHSA